MAISFVGAATGTTSATLPTHAADDVLIAFAHRDGNTTAPSLPAGWTDLGSSGANVNSSRIGYKVAASSSETSGTWTNATGLVVLVYRGCNTTDPIGDVVGGGSSSLVVAYPALTLQVTDGTSWVAAVAGHRSVDIVGLDGPPAGLTNRAYQQDATATIVGHDSASGVSSFAGASDTVTGTSGGWRSWSIELLAAAAGGSITGDIAATESGSDTAAFVGDVIISGDLAATESGADTAAFTGFVEGEIVGNLAATESGSDTAAFAGDVIISGTLAATETGSDTAAFTGTVPLSTITGTLAATESGSDSASFIGAGVVTRTQHVVRYIYRPYSNATERKYIEQLNEDLRTLYGQISSLSRGSVSGHDARESAPVGGTWQQGDFVRKFSPTEQGTSGSKYIVTGWSCVASGSPGTWVECRVLTGN